MPQVRRFQDALAKLTLTDEQKKQVDQVRQEFAEQARDLAPTLKGLPPDERRQKLQSLTADARDKLKDVLTPEQMQQLRTGMQAEKQGRQEKAADRPSGRKPLADLKQGETAEDGPAIQRVRAALATVGLTDDQKAKTDKILDDAAAETRDRAGQDPAAAREKAGPVIKRVADQLAAVLTDEQKGKLAEAMPRLGKALGAKGDGKGRGKGGGKKATKPDDGSPSTRPAAGPAAGPVAAAVAGIGAPAPAFALTKLNGVAVTNKTYAGKAVVLVFASLTSPSLRDKLPGLQTLANRDRSRTAVLLVYTREAHPSDGWQVDRNADEHVEIAQAQTAPDRLAAAKRLRDESKTTLEIAVDGMDDATAAAYAAASDTAVVVGPTGAVAGRQRWCDPSGLARLVEESLKRPANAASRPADAPAVVGM